MSMTVGDAITVAEETTEESYADAVWLYWVNQALRDLTPVLRLQEYATSTAVKDQADYSLPEDYYYMYRLVLDGTVLERYSIDTEESVSQLSKGYYVWGDYLYLVPTPVEDGEANGLEMYYFKKPVEITGTTDALGIPSEFSDAVILFIEAKSQMKEEEYVDEENFFNKYLYRRREIDDITKERAYNYRVLRFRASERSYD